MKKKSKILLLIILILAIGAIGYVVYSRIPKKQEKKVIKVIDSMKKYPYSLKENNTKLQKDLYYSLKKVLNSDEIDNKEYASLISKMFIVDVFNLDSKLNKYDIGGVDYVIPEDKEEFKTLMSDTLYDSIDNNYDKKRTQSLPIVNNIEIVSCEESKFLFDNQELLAYDISLEWEYEEDLGYDSTAKVLVALKDDIMYVVSYNPN